MKQSALRLLCSFMVLFLFAETGSAQGPSIQDAPARGEKRTGFLEEGKILLDVRARYEWADQDALDASNAGTIRTRLGYQTADFRGFSGLIEMENTIAIDENGYDAYPGIQGKPGHTLIADPRNMELNRLHVSYTGSLGNLAAGRQRIILDNARFIGNVGWRQNEQTYDAITLLNKSLKNFSVYYGYLDQANRIFGENADLQTQRHFEMDTHLINLLYDGCPFGKIAGYAYLIKVENAPANSGDTFGAYFDGAYKLPTELTLSYRAEYALQKDNSGSPDGSSFDLDYYHLILGMTWKRINVGAGYESLDGDGLRGLGTPLATLHKFNGWADVFLNTPNTGLEDYYASTEVSFKNNIVLGVVFHSFEARKGGADYGEEYDLIGAWTINKHFKLTAKYADFNGDSTSFGDVQKFWMQLEMTY